MSLINIDFYKLTGQAGFYDNQKELNYFKNFGIEAADFQIMHDILAENSAKISSFIKVLETKIENQFKVYCQKIKTSNGMALSAVNKDTQLLNQAYVSSILFLGCRLLAQEFIMLNNVDKVTYNTPITVFNPTSKKYSYRDYTISLRGYYEILSGWTLKLMSFDQGTAQILNLMDELIKANSYHLPSYKKIFMYIWMYFVAKQMVEANDFNKNLDSESVLICKINQTPLNPVDFDPLFSNIKNFQDPSKADILHNFTNWKDRGFIQRNNEQKLWEMEKLSFNDSYNFGDYFEVVTSIADCFSQKYVLNFKKFNTKFIDFLWEKNKQKYDKEFIKDVLKGMFYLKDGIGTGEILSDFANFGTYKKPILTFVVENQYFYVCAFPEIIAMSIFAQKEFVLFSEEKRKQVLQKYKELVKRYNDEYTWKIPRRFANVDSFKFSQVPHFKNITVDGNFDKFQPNSIIYEKNLNKCLFLFNYNFVESPRIWTDEKNAMRLMLGKSPTYQEFVNLTYYSWVKDFKKIKKQLKIPKDASVDMVLVVNRSFDIYPKINFENFDLFIIDIANLEYLLTNYIYKSMK